MQKVICASKIVPRPNFNPILIKSSIREMPVTISAFSMGMFVIPMTIARERFFKFIIAIHAIVPISVETMEAANAISRVLASAFIMASF